MKSLLAIAFLAAGLATPALAQDQSGYAKGKAITVSCYRGPWREVIWDRPNAKFIQSLVDAGHSYAEANAIGQRICRDATLVGDPEAMRRAMRQVHSEALVRGRDYN